MIQHLPGSSPMLCAYGDESAPDRRRDPDVDVYVLGGFLLEPGRERSASEQAGTLGRRGQAKAHWRKDGPERHDEVIAAIVKIGIHPIAVVRIGPAGEAPERRRRKCFEAFVYELELRGCDHLTLESRGPADDDRDRTMLDSLRTRGASKLLRLDHKPGPAEPLLWIADAICGAVTASRVGESRWLKALEPSIDLVVVDGRGSR